MIDYESGEWMWRYLLNWRGSVVGKALCVAVPSSLLALVLVLLKEPLEGTRDELGLIKGTTILWAAVTAPLITLLGFRTSQAWGRFWEGTGLLHAMRGEWFDSASCLCTFTCGAKSTKPNEVRDFRHTLVRLMSLCHGSALDELKINQSECYEVLDIRGLDEDTLSMLTDAKDSGFNRVEVLLHLIQVLVINAQMNGVIGVPPPILSRVYQTLSRGFVNLLNAKKIKDTKFPFPHAQAIAVMILILSVLTPLVVTSLMEEALLSMAATFVPMLGFCILNYAAEELEMPFGDDPNDLPMSHFQQEMNSSLLMLIYDRSDHVPSLRPKAHKNFESLKQSLTDTRNSLDEVLAGKGRKSLFKAALAPSQSMKNLVVDDEDSVHSGFSDLPPSGEGSVGQPDVKADPGGVQKCMSPIEVSKPEPPEDLSEAASSKAASSKAASSSHKEGKAERERSTIEKVQGPNPFIQRVQQDEEAQRRIGLQQEEKASGKEEKASGKERKKSGSSDHSASIASVRSIISGSGNTPSQPPTAGDRVNALLQGISPRLGWQAGSATSPRSPQESEWSQEQQWSTGAEARPSPPKSEIRGQDMLAGPQHDVGFLHVQV